MTVLASVAIENSCGLPRLIGPVTSSLYHNRILFCCTAYVSLWHQADQPNRSAITESLGG